MTTNWAGNVTYASSQILTPTSVAQVREAVTAHPLVTALGSRHSFNQVADTPGVQVSLAGLPAFVEVDGAARVARVGAGMTHAQVARELAAQGWAVANLASLPHISVAGAVATGTHGSGVRNASLSQAVVGVEVVRADGSLDVVGADSELLDAHRVAIGALGVVVAVHLALVPAFEVAQTVHTGLPWSALATDLETIMGAGYSVSLFTDYAGEGPTQVWTKRLVSGDVPAVDLSAWGAVPAVGPAHPVPGGDGASVTPQGGVAGPWHERLPHFRAEFTPSAGAEIQAEYLLPAEHAVAAIDAIRAISDRVTPVLFVSEIRRVAADTGWLSPSQGRDSVALHFTFKRLPDEVAAVLPAIEAALAPFDPRPHWGKVSDGVSLFRSNYPRLREFAALADELDPAGRFRNPFLAAVLAP